MRVDTIESTQIIDPLIYGSTAANGDITIRGTSHATKTTSFVLLQDDGGSVGIGTAAPATVLDILTSASSVGSRFGVRIYGDQNNERFTVESGIPIIQTGHFKGTFAAKTQTVANDVLGYFRAGGYSATNTTQGYDDAQIRMCATENFTGSSRGSRFEFWTTPNTTIVPALAMTIDQNKDVVLASTTASTSVSTGSLRVAGGMGVSGALWSQLHYSAPTVLSTGAQNVDVTVANVFYTTDTASRTLTITNFATITGSFVLIVGMNSGNVITIATSGSHILYPDSASLVASHTFTASATGTMIFTFVVYSGNVYLTTTRYGN